MNDGAIGSRDLREQPQQQPIQQPHREPGTGPGRRKTVRKGMFAKDRKFFAVFAR